VGWSLALAAVSAVYAAFWPAIGGGPEMQALVENTPKGLVTALGYDRIGSPAGYLESTVYGLLASALLLVFAIAGGARLLAGEEEGGTLELELAHPVARRRVAAEHLGVLAASVAVLVAVTTLAVLVLAAVVDMGVAVAGVLAASTGMLLLVLGFGLIAFGVGAATGRRTVALAVAAGVAVLAYVADAVAPLVEWGGWLEAVSPFSWYLAPDPLATGWHLPSLLGLAAVSVVFAAVALVGIDRRDVCV
jgi:ABC-2 type transport system permease protein